MLTSLSAAQQCRVVGQSRVLLSCPLNSKKYKFRSSITYRGQRCNIANRKSRCDATGVPDAPVRTDDASLSAEALILPAAMEAYSVNTWQWRGHTIKYAVAGEGKPVLFIHGFGASMGHYRKNIPPIASAGFKVFAIDILGFGASSKPILEYTIELWRDLVLDFMAEFIDTPTVLIGNSLGSLIALAAAAEAPEGAVAGVTLLNCAGGMNNKAVADDWRIKLAMPIFLLIDALLARPKVARYLFDRFRTPDTLRSVLLGVYSDPTAVDEALIELIYGPSCEEGALEAFVSIITGPAGPRPQDLIQRINAPLLLLWGEKDTFTPLDGPIGMYFQSLPNSRAQTQIKILPGVGHCPHDDVPELVNVALKEWLAVYH